RRPDVLHGVWGPLPDGRHGGRDIPGSGLTVRDPGACLRRPAALLPQVGSGHGLRALGAGGELDLVVDFLARAVLRLRVMANKPRVYATALPLSALPDLQDLLAPFFAAKGQPRDNVVMVRLGDEAVGRLDDLVEAGIFGSRSEAAAFLVGAGIHSQREFFDS